MARRRKNETGATVKPPVNLVAVRKSSRQIARRQSVEEKKVNGGISKIEGSNSTEEPHVNHEEQPDKVEVIKKKVGRRRKVLSREKAVNDIVGIEESLVLNRDIVESERQEAVENVEIAENIESNVSEVVVGMVNSHEVSVDESQVVWSEASDLQETNVCEMEVDANQAESSKGTIEGDLVVEQVLSMNEPSFEGKEVVEFTVIQNDDGTESLISNAGVDDTYHKTSEYIIETETVSCLDGNLTTLNNDTIDWENSIVSEIVEITEVVEEVHEAPSTDALENSSLLNDSIETPEISPIKEPAPYPSLIKENNSSLVTVSLERRRKSRNLKGKVKKVDSPTVQNQESPAFKNDESLQNSADDSSNCGDFVLTNENTTLPSKPISSPDLLYPLQNDDNSTSTSDKGEQMDHESDNIMTVVHKEFEVPEHELVNRTPTPTAQSLKLIQNNVMELKIDSEDAKMSSSSENSNDTSLSLNSIKMPEIGDKNSMTNQVESEKKDGYRQKSDTDTTGSESGSNCSAIRRSSRIRSQGLMKQRSRGRGLVTKAATEVTKLLQQEREKLQPTNTPGIQVLRDVTDSQSETQSDKENNKTHLVESNTPLMPTTVSGYDSDSTKPVKVKSRWRRSSELEMGGSAGSRLSLATLGGPLSLALIPPSSSNELSIQPKAPETTNDASYIPVFLPPKDNDSPKASPTVPSNASSPVPLLNAKILLDEETTRELDERLRQFERITENLYLTERYTNKETKRMVCDCFLTDEEVERGELGCGEDCLNRLLMIECGPRCVVSDRCTNKRFQNSEYARCEVFKTEKKGFGLRATADLDAGGFIMEYVGEVLDPRDFRRRAKEYSKDKNQHYYFMALKSDQVIDATLKGNISRFINHSCDPNAETQKWTVNGELRIGFFNRRAIAAGEEITFDYHFQRYGKEAQKCYCDSTNCRGWIGDTPDESKEKVEKKENREREHRDVKKKREVKKSYMEDADLEEEIDKLCLGGLKNRAHTLTLSRLMVRSREIEHRTRLLRVIQSGEQPCRRLFLDYHGLRLMWSYMMDVANLVTEEAQLFRLELLKTLSTLPIPNKTMLMDSKVYSVVQKWSSEEFPSPKSESPPELEVDKKEKCSLEEVDSNCDSNDKSIIEKASQNNGEKEIETPIEEVTTNSTVNSSETVKNIIETAINLLNDWSNLKEVFRIPKKERIEQMKEHEREADDGYREDLKKEEKKETSAYERHRIDRYGIRREEFRDKPDRRRGRESPDAEVHRSKEKRPNDDRVNLVSVPRLSKHERRQLFALKVAKEEQERMQRQQQEMWQEHEARCLALGIDPHTTAAVDPQTGYPLFFNSTLGQWQSYPLQEGADVYLGHQIHQNIPAEISPAGLPTPVYGVAYTGLSQPQTPQQFADNHMPLQGNIPHNGSTPSMSISGQHVYLEKPMDQQFPVTSSVEAKDEASPAQPEMPLDLPPKWKCAKDARGRFYYYHIKERIPQWLPPPPIHIGASTDSTSSSESSEDSSSSEEDIEEPEEIEDEKLNDDIDPVKLQVLDQNTAPVTRDPRIHSGNSVNPEPKKRRDGLVQERIISPRREDKVDHKKYKDVKEKIRRQKERSKMKDPVDKQRKHRRTNKAKSHARHTANKLQAIAESSELTAERKIKDTFRINMANVMVRFLNPFRQNDCKQGRITNTEDFKYLARKLTHFVMAKELKHCRSVEELQCNENVKHKAKDFVRKYMGKFGPVYQRSSDED